MAFKTPTPEQKVVLEKLDEMEKAMKFLTDKLKESAPRRASITATKFEEAFMFARKAVVKKDDEL